MIIFLHGPDDYRREEKKRWYVAEFKKKYPEAGRGVFDFAESKGCEDFEVFVSGESLFETKKLVIIENLYEADEKTLPRALPQLVDKKSTIILCSEKKKPVKALQFLLEKPAVVEEFPSLIGPAWAAFIQSKAKSFGFALDDAALRFLADVYKGNSWGVVTELEKLVGLKKAMITRKDLDGFDLEAAPDYWAVLNALKGQNPKNRLWALEKLLSLGDPAPKIFNILASQWRERLPAMAAYDLAVKSGKLEYEEALVDLVISN